MEISRQADPRANQKERTRAALVAAAGELLRAGASPTVAEAAERAKVSRATAYRYFPTQESLLIEVVELSPATAPVETLLERLSGDDAEARLRQLLDAFNPVLLAEQVPMRTALRVYLDTWLDSRRHGQPTPVVREGRRMRWLDKTLEPVRRELSKSQWQRLRCALALTLGADAIVVMKDVCRLDDAEALAVLQWAATTLLQAGLGEARTKARRRARGS